MPAVVNISVELKEQAAAQGDENTENPSASPFEPGGTPFDQFLKRFFEQPFDPPIPRKKSWRSAPGSSNRRADQPQQLRWTDIQSSRPGD
jgi:hypothetical protein